MEIYRKYHFVGFISVLLFGLFASTACGPNPTTSNLDELNLQDEKIVLTESALVEEVDLTTVDEEGVTTIELQNLEEALASAPSNELSQEEMDGLLFMREEEKLAHDVYIKLYEIWGLPIFENIAQSEQTHTEAVLAIIIRYGLDDPAANSNIGEFSNTALQDLYNQLIEQGSQSLADALKVGALIEEIDILDLEEHLADTSNQAIVSVYENLLTGSRNHLRAFVSTLENQTQEEYSPQRLSLDVFEEIISSGIERGGNRNGQGRNQGNGS
jgi:hypothetical protein